MDGNAWLQGQPQQQWKDHERWEVTPFSEQETEQMLQHYAKHRLIPKGTYWLFVILE